MLTRLPSVHYHGRMTTFWQELEYADFRALVLDDEPPVDTDGFWYSRFIPGQYVDECLHADWYTDAFDGVFRCIDCDEPI